MRKLTTHLTIILLLIPCLSYANDWQKLFLSNQGKELCKRATHSSGPYSISHHPVIHLNENFFVLATSTIASNTSTINYFIKDDPNKKTLKLEHRTRALKIVENKLYVLGNDTLSAIDLITQKTLFSIPTQDIVSQQQLTKYHLSARGFDIINNIAYVAHGTLGLMVIDLKSKMILEQVHITPPQPEGKHISMIEDIKIKQDGTAIVAYDNYTGEIMGARAFEGFALIDIYNLSPLKFKAIKQYAEALARVQILSVKNEIAINNFGLLFNYNPNKIWSDRYAVPQRRLWSFPNKGAIIGRPFMTKDHIFACLRYNKQNPISGSHYKVSDSFLLERSTYRF